jgi:hypothetical protein
MSIPGTQTIDPLDGKQTVNLLDQSDCTLFDEIFSMTFVNLATQILLDNIYVKALKRKRPVDGPFSF